MGSGQLAADLGLVPSRVSVLRELEASLQASQRALLNRDVSELEQHTSEQVRLQKTLTSLWSCDAHSMASDPACSDVELAVEVRAALIRVQHLSRIQAALVARAQQSLRIIENLLAGPQANYAPPNRRPDPMSTG